MSQGAKEHRSVPLKKKSVWEQPAPSGPHHQQTQWVSPLHPCTHQTTSTSVMVTLQYRKDRGVRNKEHCILVLWSILNSLSQLQANCGQGKVPNSVESPLVIVSVNETWMDTLRSEVGAIIFTNSLHACAQLCTPALYSVFRVKGKDRLTSFLTTSIICMRTTGNFVSLRHVLCLTNFRTLESN